MIALLRRPNPLARANGLPPLLAALGLVVPKALIEALWYHDVLRGVPDDELSYDIADFAERRAG